MGCLETDPSWAARLSLLGCRSKRKNDPAPVEVEDATQVLHPIDADLVEQSLGWFDYSFKMPAHGILHLIPGQTVGITVSMNEFHQFPDRHGSRWCLYIEKVIGVNAQHPTKCLELMWRINLFQFIIIGFKIPP